MGWGWLAWLAFAIRAPRHNTDGTQGTVNPFALPGADVGAEQEVFAANDPRWRGRYIRVVTDVDARICFYSTTGAEDADDNDWPLWAGQPQDFFVIPGSSGFFSVYSETAGTCWWYIG